MFNRSYSDNQKLRLTFEKVYSELHSILVNAIADANAKQKKLLLIAGEHHSQGYSLVLQIILLLVARNLGIGNLVIEFSEDIVRHILYSPRQKKILNTEFSIPFASQKLNMNLIASDLGISQQDIPPEKRSEIREENMINSCLQMVKDHALFIIGSTHVKPLTQQLKDKFHIVALNISATSLKESIEFFCLKLLNFINPEILNCGPVDEGARYDFIMNANEVKQINCDVDFRFVKNNNLYSAILAWYSTYQPDQLLNVTNSFMGLSRLPSL